MTGEQLRYFRERAGYTQKALGIALGYEPHAGENTVQHWERGERQIPVKHFRKLCELLGITLEDLVP